MLSRRKALLFFLLGMKRGKRQEKGEGNQLLSFIGFAAKSNAQPTKATSWFFGWNEGTAKSNAQPKKSATLFFVGNEEGEKARERGR